MEEVDLENSEVIDETKKKKRKRVSWKGSKSSKKKSIVDIKQARAQFCN